MTVASVGLCNWSGPGSLASPKTWSAAGAEPRQGHSLGPTAARSTLSHLSADVMASVGSDRCSDCLAARGCSAGKPQRPWSSEPKKRSFWNVLEASLGWNLPEVKMKSISFSPSARRCGVGAAEHGILSTVAISPRKRLLGARGKNFLPARSVDWASSGFPFKGTWRSEWTLRKQCHANCARVRGSTSVESS